MSKHDATRYIDADLSFSGGPRMGVAHTYADLEARLTRLKEELKFRALGRVVAEVITTSSGEPRLSIGEYELTEEHALKLSAWIQQVFQLDERK